MSMAKKREGKTTAEAFIAAVMRHANGTIQNIADELGVTQQAVSKRLREYKERGIEGLPDFTGQVLDVDGVQKLVNKYRRK
jgi:predicted transcriptional regulator